MTAEDVIQLLQLTPLQLEGGFYRETLPLAVDDLLRVAAPGYAGTALHRYLHLLHGDAGVVLYAASATGHRDLPLLLG